MIRLAELIGEEHIDWTNFRVTDPEAPEYEPGPDGEADPAAAQIAPIDDGHGDDEPIASEDTAAEPPRDPATGQYLSGDPPGDDDHDDEEIEAPAPVSSGDPLLDKYLAKYGGDMEKAVRAAAHQDDVVGRQGVELGDMRQQMAELLEAVNRPAPPPLPSLHDIDAVFADDPMAAAERTLQVGGRTGDYSAHNDVIRAWREIDPAQVGLYENQKRIERAIYESEQRTTQAAQQAQAAAQAPVQYQSALASAEARLKAEFPDLDLKALEPAMIEEAVQAQRVAGEDSVYARMMESGDPEKVYFGLRTLALTAHNAQSAEVRQRVADNARTAAVETQRAKAAAMVTSATGTGADPAPPKSYDEELLEKFQKEDQTADGFRIGNY